MQLESKYPVETGTLGGGDIGAWFAQQGFTDEELTELYDFRNSLLHGVVIVHRNGSVEIFDKQKGQRIYTADEIRHYAALYYSLRFENRTTLSVSAQSICKCGATFANPEGNEELQEHIKNCSYYEKAIDLTSQGGS